MSKLDFPFHETETLEGQSALVFTVGTEDIMKFEANGDVYVRGQLVDSNKAIYAGFKEWLQKNIPDIF